MSVKIDGTNGIDVAQLRAPDGDPVALTISNAGKVATPQNTRSWQNVGASRIHGTVYTNDTGQDIEVAVQVTNPANVNATMTMFVGAMAPFYSFTPAAVNASGMTGYVTVPAGETYKVDLIGATLGQWLELR